MLTICTGPRRSEHAEICFEGTDCPLCEALSRFDDKERECENLQTQNDTLSDEKTDLERTIVDYEERITQLETES